MTIAVAGLLVIWFGFGRIGERGRVAQCAGNLKVLGQATHQYVNDHSSGLPAAAVSLEGAKNSWDAVLFSYLKPKLAKAEGAYAKRQLLLAVGPSLQCPADSVDHTDRPRSYAMAGRDMTLDWPPSPRDATGVGLWWDKRTVSEALGESAVQQAVNQPESLPKLKVSVLPAPAETLLLTELLAQDNNLGNIPRTRVWNIEEQRASLKRGSSRFHFGRFNYLMADGHVELLTGLQAGGSGAVSGGIWTIKAGD